MTVVMGVVVNRLVVVVVNRGVVNRGVVNRGVVNWGVVNWGVVNWGVVNRGVETRRAVGHGVCFVSGRIKS